MVLSVFSHHFSPPISSRKSLDLFSAGAHILCQGSPMWLIGVFHLNFNRFMKAHCGLGMSQSKLLEVFCLGEDTAGVATSTSSSLTLFILECGVPTIYACRCDKSV